MKENWVYRRGDIYLANLGVPIGSKQGGVRPVVVLQNDVGNFYSPTITVAPLTTKIQKKRNQPTHYFLRKAKGLARSSMVLAEQLDTCDKTCVIRYLGKVSKGQMRGIDEAVKVQLGYYIPEQAEKKRQGKCRKEVNFDTMDFQVTPHQLRHTYITNLIYASVDPKTVQYLAGHENSKVTMDIYAKVKYNKPAQLHGVINRAIDTSKKD